MFRRVLIANRGEIALRILRACRAAGITPIMAYSEVDRDTVPVRLADERICIGPAPSAASYLNLSNILAAAQAVRAEAIHPGCGFLAENPAFAIGCRENGIVFIGPSPEALQRTGDKAACRRMAREAGVPVLPGSDSPVEGFAQAREAARAIGFPLMIKAVSGGGGRGLRCVHDEAELAVSLAPAADEARVAFGDPRLYLERFLPDARHIEFQVLADREGHVQVLDERDGSIQRRHQKLIEESPSPALNPALRARVQDASAHITQALGFTTAGTAEFLLSPEGAFYFMEFNARLQVEHPVTEARTGVDLVGMQMALAAGEAVSAWPPVSGSGWAIEARICAEDPERGFAPAPGRITACRFPGGPGIRVDSHIESGSVISPHYDSLMGKIIAWGDTRAAAAQRLASALDEMCLEGVPTTAGYCARMLRGAHFQS